MIRPGGIGNGAAGLVLVCSWLWASDADAGAFGQDAVAQSAAEGLELSLRTGYATGRGPRDERRSLSEVVSVAVPLWAELGYRFDRWLVGGYAQAALGFNGATVDALCPDCSTTWMRLGIEVQYTFYERDRLAMWLGLGSGRQWLNTTIDNERRLSQATRGWEFVGLSVGSGVEIIDGITLGPFSTWSLGQFDVSVSKCAEERRCSRAEARVETQLSGLALHSWFFTGLRVSVLP